MTTQLPPDYEDSHTLALTLCQHLGINPEHVLLGTMQIELGPDHKHRITWTGHAHLNLDDLTGILTDTAMRRHLEGKEIVGTVTVGKPRCVNAPLCDRDAGHDGQCTLATDRPHSHPPGAPCHPAQCTGHPDWSRINRPT